MHRDRRARARRGRPARPRDPRPGVRDLRRGAVPRDVCAAAAGRCARAPASTIVAEAGLEALARADTVLVPGFAPHLRVSRRAGAGRAARRPRARRAHGLDLHRRVRARRRRRARRPPRDHPLARRRRPRRPLPARRRRARRPLHRRGPGADLRGRRRRAWTSACTSCAATTAPRWPTAIARRIVVPPHRDGGQAQYVEQPLPSTPGGSLAATRAWALERLHEPLTVRALAAHAHVSERTFARRFSAETGVPVLRWLLAQRVDAARAALESTDALDRRDRPPLRLRHRREPAQALPPPRRAPPRPPTAEPSPAQTKRGQSLLRDL